MFKKTHTHTQKYPVSQLVPLKLYTKVLVVGICRTSTAETKLAKCLLINYVRLASERVQASFPLYVKL